jgi:hypothetical protein
LSNAATHQPAAHNAHFANLHVQTPSLRISNWKYFVRGCGRQPDRPHRAGVIYATRALHIVVIPAKAGIHFANPQERAVDGLDSRFRGNDLRFERDAIPTPSPTLSLTGYRPFAKFSKGKAFWILDF